MRIKSTLPHQASLGAVLLEVILALVLFAAAATIVGTSLTSAMESVERQKLAAHAGNLATTIISEIQLGIRSASSSGPAAFEKPFEHWTWQVVPTATETEAGESSDLTRVEVVIRHDDPGLVHHLTRVVRLGRRPSPSTAANAGP